jgi:hypothetical protein
MTRSTSVPPTIAVANKQIVLPPAALVFIAEMKKTMKYAEKMSTGPTTRQTLTRTREV